MKFKSKILCIFLVFVLLLSVSTVAANEDTTQSFKEDSAYSVSANVETNTEFLGISGSEESLGAPDAGTFTALQQKINRAQAGEIIVLENNYTRTDNFNRNAITISKAITIDGNGYTIDALKKGRIFQVTASNVILKNINFVNGNSTPSGGAVFWSGTDGVLYNCSFVNCSSTSTGSNSNTGGGAVYWSGSSGVLGNCSFVNCSATFFTEVYGSQNGGGAVYWSGDSGVLGNCSFVNCFYSSSTGPNGNQNYKVNGGGAVYWLGNSGVLGNCSFVNCSYTSSYSSSLLGGGAVYWCGDSGVLGNCSFVNCSVTGNGVHGGAIFWINGYIVGNCSFVNCSATDIYANGGAVYLYRPNNAVLRNCSFVNCSDSGSGSAVYVFGGYNSVLSNCSFVNCSTGGYAVCWFGNSGVLGNCSFVNCSTGGYAVFWLGDSGVLGNCSFVNCSEGGAVYWSGDSGVLGNCSFVNCSAKSKGGAVYWTGKDGVLSNCSFVNCSTISTGSYVYIEGGGAVYWYTANGVLANCSFVNCSSSVGGAVYLRDGSGVLGNCSFVNCSATNGGAVYWNGAGGVLGNCSFVNCSSSSDNGGAVYWFGVDGRLSGSNFTGNNARYGGAVYWNGAKGVLDNCSFVNCSAVVISSSGSSYIERSGGAVYWNGVNGTLSCSIFTDNKCKADGTAISWMGNGGVLGNCSFMNCSVTSDSYSAIYWSSANSVLGNCSFVNCKSSHTIRGGSAIQWWGSGVLANCTFVNCSTSGALGGGAVFWTGRGVLVNCSFVNCSNSVAQGGGAVYWFGAGGVLVNCTFVNCKATRSFCGGAVFWRGNDGVLGNCSFVNCSATGLFGDTGDGGAVHWEEYAKNGVLGNCSFVNCFTDGKGGAVLWSSTDGVLGNCSFVNCSADKGGAVYWGYKYYSYYFHSGILVNSSFMNCSASSGGAVYWEFDFGVLSGSNFTGNNASYGGAVYWVGVDGRLSGSNFTGNNASYGGAVYWNGTDGSLSGSNFAGNNASIGGAVYWYGVNGTLDNSSFVNCSSTTKGSAVYWESGNGLMFNCNFTTKLLSVLWMGENGSMVNCSFVNCSNDYYDHRSGAISWYGVNGSIVSCSFVNCSRTYGGAIYWNGENGSVADSLFVDCFGNEAGGAISWDGVNSSVSNCSFVNCSTHSTDSGGGAIMWQSANGHVSNCSFVDCYADGSSSGYGGAIYWANANGVLGNCSFVNCSAEGGPGYRFGYGGAVYWMGSSGVLGNCSFVNCSAEGGPGYNLGYGGAVHWDGNNGVLDNSSFVNCSADNGGAVYWEDNIGIITNSSFEDNFAKLRGGALYWTYYRTSGDFSQVINSLFINNAASYGGGIHFYKVNAKVNNSYFRNNSAEHSGGISVRYSTLTVDNSNFTSNRVSHGGGAIGNDGENPSNVKVEIKNSNFDNNHANNYGGAISLESVTVDNSTFDNNSAVFGGAIYSNSPTVKNSKFKNNNALELGNSIFAINKATVENSNINNNDIYENSLTESIIYNYQKGSPYKITYKRKTYDAFAIESNLITPNGKTNDLYFVDYSLKLARNVVDSSDVSENLKFIAYQYFKGLLTYSEAASMIDSTVYGKSRINSKAPEVEYIGNNMVNIYEYISLITPSSNTNFYFMKQSNQTLNYTVTKEALNKTVYVGDIVEFRINVTNGNNFTLPDVFVRDVFNDTEFEYLSFESKDSWTYNVNSKVFTLKSLSPSNTSSLILSFKVKVNGTLTNIVVGGIGDNETVNNNTTVTVYNPQLSVEKTCLTPTVILGQTARFEIVVKNNGDTDLHNVTITEIPDPDLVFDSYDKTSLWNHSIVNNKHVWTLVDALKPGTSASLYVNFTTADVGRLVNYVDAESNETNKSRTGAGVDVIRPVIQVKKIAFNDNVTLGKQAVFEIIVSNPNVVSLKGVRVYETSFDGLVYDSFKASDRWVHSIIRGVNAWTFKEDLHPGEKISFFTVFNTTTNGTFVNNVVASSDNTIDAQANATVNVLKPDFKVKKIVLTPKVTLGEQASYEVVVHNTGETDLTNIVVEEMPDASLIYDHYVDKGLFKHSVVAGKHVWTLDKLTKGEYAGFILYFNTTRAGNISNQIIVKCDEDPENTTVSNNTTVVIPSFSLEKISLTPTVVLGQSVLFEIVIRNTGKAELTNVYFTEDSFDGLVYDSAVGEGIWIHKFENDKHTWTLNDVLEPDEFITLTLKFNTTVSGKFTNFVSAASDQTEGVYANASVTVLKPEFKVEKIVLTPKVALGEQVRYEIIVHNTGEANLTNIVVEELPDASLIFDHYVDGGLFKHSVVAGKHVWTLDKLAKGTYAGFILYFNTTRAGNVSNQIVVKSDEIPENTTVSNNTTVLLPAFIVEKICLYPNVLVGNQTLFQIVIKNTGKVELTDVYFSEDSFDGLIYDSAIGEGIWTHKFENGKHTWTLNEALEPDELAVLTLRFNTTAKGNYTNFVSAASNQTEALFANATVHVFEGKVPEPPAQNTTEMDVFKIVITQEAVLGGQITFQFVVHNTGNANLENAKISEILPEGLIYSHFVDYLGLWRYNGDLSWSATRAILPGEYAGFFVTFNTTKAGKFENHIVVTANNTNTTPGNTSFEVLNPVFTIEKILVEDNIINGGQAVFEIVIHNTGNAPLSGVTVKEFDFNGLIYSDFVDYLDLWTYNGDLSWTMNTKLMPGEYAELLVIFNTTDVGNFTNFVSGSSNETGIQIVNATVHVLDDKPDPEQNSSDDYSMDVFKIVITQEAVLGGQITFQFVVHNTGNKNLENVKISEMLPEGLIYSHFVDYLDLWMYNGDLIWSATRAIVPGEYVGFFVTFNTTKAGKSVNHIVVTANNTNTTPANTSFEVLNPDFTVEKILVEDNIVNGNQAVFEIVVHNTGSASLTNLTVREYFFEGLIYDHFTDYLDLWTYNGDLSWTMNAKLLPGEYVGFFVTFNTTKDGVFTNIVVANSSECDNKFSNTSVSVHNETVDISQICLTPLVVVGNQAIFEIIVRNTGKVNIDNLKLSEFDYEGLIYDHYMDYLGHWINDGITWTLNTTLVPGEVTSLFVVFNTTRVGNFTNVVLANKATADTNELLSANSLEDGIYVSADVEVVKPEYTIEKVALNKTANIGDEVVFEIIVHNVGKVDISNITLRDIPSDGLSYLRFVDDENLWFKNADLSWNLVGNLTSGEYSIFYIVFNATKAGTLENTLVSDNLTSKTTVEVNNPVVPINPSLIIEAEIITDPITGKQVLKVTVINTGDVDLDNVFVRPKLPEGLRYGDYYSYDSVWNFNNGAFDLEGILKVAESRSFYIEILGEPGEYLIPIDGGYNNTITDSTEVFVKILDNSTPGNVTPEVPDDVNKEWSSLAAGEKATGNPLVMVLLSLIALGFIRLGKKY